MATKIVQLATLQQKKELLQQTRASLRLDLQKEPTLSTQKNLDKTERDIQVADERIHNLVQVLYSNTATEPLEQLDESVPILMFPLRIETRFMGNELWIRVFPDEVAIQTHEAVLTASELDGGMFYWKTLWMNHKNYPKQTVNEFEAFKKQTWEQIANHFGANRASWIIKQTRPLKFVQAKQDDFSTIGSALDPNLDLEPDPAVKKTKIQAWSEPSASYVMPDLLKLKLYGPNDELWHEALGLPIPYPLIVGPNPNPKTTTPINPSPDMDWTGTDIEWLQNFDKAVTMGMGFKVDLTHLNKIPATSKYDATQGFSKLMIIGVRAAGFIPHLSGRYAVNKLFESHIYSNKGFGLLPQGTPTNNSEKGRSGLQAPAGFTEERYARENQPAFTATALTDKTDGQLFAEALALDMELLRTVENSQNTDYREAVQMNKALYPATLGFFTEHLLHESSPTLFTTNNLRDLRTFFCEYVTGRGALPVFRVGSQPYGVLPTSNFEKWKWTKYSQGLFIPVEFVNLFHKLQQTLMDIQDNVHKKNIKNVGHVALDNNSSATDILDEILSLHPNSETFFQRLGYNMVSIGKDPETDFNAKLLKQVKGKTADYTEGVLQLGRIAFENKAYKLNVKYLVDSEAVSESTQLTIPSEIPNEITKGRDSKKDEVKPKNYIGWLCNIYIKHRIRNSIGGNPPIIQIGINGIEQNYFLNKGETVVTPPLLYLLLKHGFLLELYKCTYYLLERDQLLPKDFSLFSNGSNPPNFIATKEFFNKIDDFGNKIEDLTPMELLAYNHQDLSAYLVENLPDITQNFQTNAPNVIATRTFERLGEFFNALKELEHLPTARLERCLVEHLDCLTYRLDAWQTGMFYQKLEESRKKIGAQSLYIGAFGWLENIKPKPSTTYMANSAIPVPLQPTNGKPVIEADGVGGYIQAPSIGQAKAAALLRNAYLHHHDAKNPDLMAVNLSSDRVRKALQLFEGIQKGQSIEALLGYQFERGMHDANLDQYILAFRDAFPLETKPISGASVIKNSSSVANGLAMFKAKKDIKIYPFGKSMSPAGSLPAGLNSTDILTIEAILGDLVDSVDAMQDLIVAESMYQLAQGNADRAGALLKSIGEFKPPPVFEVVKTPRSTAHQVTHRICLLFEAETSLSGSPWAGIAVTPRALAESGLNKWLGKMIGYPNSIECVVEQTNSDGTKSNGPVLLFDLAIQPIDLISLIDKTAKSPDSVLSKRIAYAYRQKYSASDETTLEIQYDQLFDQSETWKITFSEIIPLLWRLKELIANARPLNAGDFDLQSYAGRRNPNNYIVEREERHNTAVLLADVGDLVKRKTKIYNDLTAIQQSLKAILNFGIKDLNAISANLLKLANFGYAEAFPKSTVSRAGLYTSLTYTTLTGQAEDMLKMLDKKLLEAKDLQDITKEVDTHFESWVKELTAQIKLLANESFQILPRFTFKGQEDKGEVNRVPEIQSSVTNENTLFKYVKPQTELRNPKKYISNWLKSLTRVRPRIANLEMVNVLHNALLEKDMDWHVIQTPWASGDAWMALDIPATMPTQSNKLSILSNLPDDFNNKIQGTGTFCGLLLDEWVEEIPNEEETTGITFQHDQPNSQPPQTLLLAVSPTDGGKWDWDKLTGILNDTFDRAKRRGVSTKDMTDSDWFSLLPGVISEFSHTNANVSLFFRDLMK